MNNNFRKKVMIVPYIKILNDIHVLMVKDNKSNDWTFITGGCKQSENILNCAKRELQEESFNALTFPSKYEFFSFFTTYRPYELKIQDSGRKVVSKYFVYLFELDNQLDIEKYYNLFHKNMKQETNSKKKETKDITLKSLKRLQYFKEKNIWDFILNTCVPNIVNYFNTK